MKRSVLSVCWGAALEAGSRPMILATVALSLVAARLSTETCLALVANYLLETDRTAATWIAWSITATVGATLICAGLFGICSVVVTQRRPLSPPWDRFVSCAVAGLVGGTVAVGLVGYFLGIELWAFWLAPTPLRAGLTLSSLSVLAVPVFLVSSLAASATLISFLYCVRGHMPLTALGVAIWHLLGQLRRWSAVMTVTGFVTAPLYVAGLLLLAANPERSGIAASASGYGFSLILSWVLTTYTVALQREFGGPASGRTIFSGLPQSGPV